MRHIIPGLKKKKFCLDSNKFGFICDGVKNVGGCTIDETPDEFELSVTDLVI